MQQSVAKIFALFFIAVFLIGANRVSGGQAQDAKDASAKAAVLEENAAQGDSSVPSASEIITKPESQAVDPVGDEPLEEAIVCLSRTIYWETRGEQAASMSAVASVVMNRLAHSGFPDTICEVVKQGQEQGACQFSWWCDGHPDDAEDDKSYVIAKEVARKTLNGQTKDATGGALYFHDINVTPDWSAEYQRTASVGKFVFYKPDNGAAK